MEDMRRLLRLMRSERFGLSDPTAIIQACKLIAGRLRSKSCYILYSSDYEGQRQLGLSHEMLPSPIDQEAYVAIGRGLLRGSAPVAYDLEDGVVRRLVTARAGVRRDYLATPTLIHPESEDVLVVEGISRPLKTDDIDYAEAAGVIAGRLAAGTLDASNSNRRREQLTALADIGRVMAKTAARDEMLGDLATAISAAAGFDVVAIAVFDESKERVAYHAINEFRFSNHHVADGFRAGLFDRHFLDVGRRRRPVVLRDLTTEDDETLLPPEKQVLVDLAVFTSLVVLPLMVRDEVIGTISFCAYARRELSEDELTLISGLGTQTAVVIKGLDLYEQLRVSNERLEQTSMLLRESMSVEHRIARTDFLTGLPNRRYVEEALEGESTVRAANGSLSVVLSDIDGFKAYNDDYGHGFGDDVLKLVATLARRVCGEGDIAARYAGDEFVFLLPGKSRSEARRVAEEFRRQVSRAELQTPDGGTLRVSVSVGVCSIAPGIGGQQTDVLAEADAAMYRAKSEGGDSVSVARQRTAQEASTTSAA